MNIGNSMFLTLVTIFTFAFCGCSCDEKFHVGGVLEPENRVQESMLKEGAKNTIEELKPEDIIVAVNGYPFYKRNYSVLMQLKAKEIMARKGMNSLMAEKLLAQYQAKIVRTFVAQRLMIDNALKLGIVTTNAVDEHVSEALQKLAQGKSVSKFLKGLNGYSDYYLYDLGVAFAMNELIKAKIPPLTTVDSEFVSNVQHQVAIENAVAKGTNAVKRSQMLEWRKQILDNRLDFTVVSKQFSEKDEMRPDVDASGIWGDFEESDFDDPVMRESIFSLKEGCISDVLEDDNGYHIVKVLSIDPPAFSEKGRMIKHETRKLQHIYLEKVPMLLEQTDVEMTKDLKGQMQVFAINDYVQNLSTNGENSVIYPHGTTFFK